jgi:hypothetical protein
MSIGATKENYQRLQDAEKHIMDAYDLIAKAGGCEWVSKPLEDALVQCRMEVSDCRFVVGV